MTRTLAVWHTPQPAKRKRIALAGERNAAIGWIAKVPVLIEAAGARVEWIGSGKTIPAIERAIENSHAVVASPHRT